MGTACNARSGVRSSLCRSGPDHSDNQSTLGSFSVDRVEDVEWNTSPFESLVLPDGYKDLILSFVESQLKEGDTFDDVINGKGKPQPSFKSLASR